jgi:hypothetical protein
MSTQSKYVTCVLIGDTGVGKSEFGNRYLGSRVFEANDSAFPVTLEPKTQSAFLNGMTRYVIDTEGHADGNSISSEQIQKLSIFLKNWNRGVNGVCVILNGQNDRFSQGIKDTLRWAYNTFGTSDVLSHICIIFTRCYDGIIFPNRERKQNEYRQVIQRFLSEISGVPNVPSIPIFFVDSLSSQSAETERNLTQFHGWLVSRQPLSTNSVQAVALRDKVEDEFANRVFVRYRYSGPTNNQYRFAVYEDRKRQKFTPYNGDAIRYSEWIVTRQWEESAGYKTIVTHTRTREAEVKEVEHHGAHSWTVFSSHDHTHYTIKRKTWHEEWTVTKDFDGHTTETTPRQVGGVSWRTIDSDRERGWTNSYERIIS